jgi:predicted RNase H-like HicB family nuclease
MNKYEIILYWSEEDEAFIAEVPELPGCAGDGPTRQEALTNVAATPWLADL